MDKVKDRKFYRALESLRGILSIAIAVYHFKKIGQLYLAVDVFFVLSGFILYKNYADSLKSMTSKARFLFRRFARLYPLQIFSLCFMFFVVWLLDSEKIFSTCEYSLYNFILNIFLIQSTGLEECSSWNFPSWSISAEVQIAFLYCFFCFIFRKVPSTLLLLFGGALYTAIVLHFGHLDVFHEKFFGINSGVLRCLGGFCLGVFLCRSERAKIFRFIGEKASFFEIFVFFVGGLVLFWQQHYLLEFFGVALAMLAIGVFSMEKGVVSRFIVKRVFLFFGKISYSIYLLHIPILMLCREFLADNFYLLFASYILILLLASSVSYYCLEKPLRSLMLRCFDRRQAT